MYTINIEINMLELTRLCIQVGFDELSAFICQQVRPQNFCCCCCCCCCILHVVVESAVHSVIVKNLVRSAADAVVYLNPKQ